MAASLLAVVVVVIVGHSLVVRSESSLDGLPRNLNCAVGTGHTPPTSMSVAGVDIGHHGDDVVTYTIRFRAAPPKPTFAAGNRTGPFLTFRLTNSNKAFASIGGNELGLYGFMSFAKEFTNEYNVAIDDKTYVEQSGDTIVISVELAKFAVSSRSFSPGLTVSSINASEGNGYPGMWADQECTP